MNEQEMLSLFSRILGDLLGDDSLILHASMTRGDVPEWDSFNYVNFIVAVEAELGIRFRIADVESFETIGDIVAEAQALLGTT